MPKNWIELVEEVGDFEGMEVWQAICHHDGYQTAGWALVGEETTDFYETDPRELPGEDLVDGWRLPSYETGHQPEELKIYEAIVAVSRGTTNFDTGFDYLFGFMAKNPDARTTEKFIDYHVIDMASPSLNDGTPEFTYLIGQKFEAKQWVDPEDIEAFQAYVEQRKNK